LITWLNLDSVNLNTIQLMVRIAVGSLLEQLTDWLDMNPLIIPAVEGVSLSDSQLSFSPSFIRLETDLIYEQVSLK
jgi:hypothetical protein